VLTTTVKRVLMAAAVTATTCSLLGGCGDEKDEPTTPRDAVTTVKGPGFTVEMPGKPKRSTTTVRSPEGSVNLTVYTVDRGDEAYHMFAGTLPTGVELDLDAAIEGAATKVHGTVAEQEDSEYQGFPARDARITDAEAANAKATLFQRVIAAEDRRYYLLQYITEGADVRVPPEGYQGFLESLEID
jgi:hypothetical protein